MGKDKPVLNFCNSYRIYNIYLHIHTLFEFGIKGRYTCRVNQRVDYAHTMTKKKFFIVMRISTEIHHTFFVWHMSLVVRRAGGGVTRHAYEQDKKRVEQRTLGYICYFLAHS